MKAAPGKPYVISMPKTAVHLSVVSVSRYSPTGKSWAFNRKAVRLHLGTEKSTLNGRHGSDEHDADGKAPYVNTGMGIGPGSATVAPSVRAEADQLVQDGVIAASDVAATLSS